MIEVQDKIRNVAIGFTAIFILNLLNLFIPFWIFVGISGIYDFNFYLNFSLMYYVNMDEMIVNNTYQLIFYIITIIIYIKILSYLKEIELDLMGDDHHTQRTKKYFFMSFVYPFLTLYQGFLLIVLMYTLVFAFILLYLAIGGLVGTVYFAIFLYNIGKETDNMLIKIGGILFIIGPLLSALSILVSLPAIFSFGSLEFSHFFFGIISFVDSIISGVGFFLLMNNYEGARYERRAAPSQDYRRPEESRYRPPRDEYYPPPSGSYEDSYSRSEPRETSQPISEIRCPSCGNPCPSSDSFCKNCGRFLQA